MFESMIFCTMAQKETYTRSRMGQKDLTKSQKQCVKSTLSLKIVRNSIYFFGIMKICFHCSVRGGGYVETVEYWVPPKMVWSQKKL